MPSFKIIVVGSGLAGSLLANGLVKYDINVAVYDKIERHSKRDGYQIRLGESALKGMRACLTQSHIELAVSKFGRANGTRAGGMIIYDNKFRVLVDTTGVGSYEKSAPIGRGVLRDVFADPLSDAGRLQYKKVFTRYEILDRDTRNEKVRVWFADETFDDCDILIGADGAHSRINAQVGLNNLHVQHSHVGFLTKSELPTRKFLGMSKELLAGAVGIASDRGQLFFSAYLPDKVAMADVSEFEQAGKGAEYDESISSLFFAYSFPADDLPSGFYDWPKDKKWDWVAERFKKLWSPRFGEIVELVKGGEPYVFNPTYSVKPPSNWRSKVTSATEPEKGNPRVMLVGDAMHAMLPNMGQGGNQSLRDTSVLLPQLIDLAQKADPDYGVSNAEVAKACSAYEAEMIPRGFEYVRKSGGSSAGLPDANTYFGRLWWSMMGAAFHVYEWYWHFQGFLGIRKEGDEGTAPELMT